MILLWIAVSLLLVIPSAVALWGWKSAAKDDTTEEDWNDGGRF